MLPLINKAVTSLFNQEDNRIKVLRDAFDRELSGLQAVLVKTKDYKGILEFFGKQDEYTTLFDLAPEMWNNDKNGMFNIEAAEKFLETNSDIDAEIRRQIEDLIKLKDAYDEAMAVIDEQLESTFGSLSSSITDTIFDAVRNGTDAWEGFEEAGLQVIDTLGKQLVQELYVNSYLEQFKERMTNAYGLGSIEETQYELAAIMSDIYNGLGAVLEGARTAAQDWDRMATEGGFDMTKLADTDTTASDNTLKGAYAKASQESIDLLAGQTGAVRKTLELMYGIMSSQSPQAISDYMTPVRDTLTVIRDLQVEGWQNVREMRTIMLDLRTLQDNMTDVANKTLTATTQIEANTKGASGFLQTMNQNGIKVNLPPVTA
jgi:hypothetical protein